MVGRWAIITKTSVVYVARWNLIRGTETGEMTMGYMHIDNLYRNPEFLNYFKEVWISEKVHGSSAHISLSPKGLRFFAGGEKHENFVRLFDQNFLQSRYDDMKTDSEFIVYGEVYGASMQGMSDVYGKKLSFIAFDVKFGKENKYWMELPEAVKFVDSLGLEFVPYLKVENTLEILNNHRDKPSEVAMRRGMGDDKESEGIVIKPPVEMSDKFGERIIYKHKRAKFRETARIREVNPDKIQVMNDAKEFAKEYVVPQRLAHVLDKIEQPHDITKTGIVVKAMIEDVKREHIDGEVEWSKDVEKAVGYEASQLYKQRFNLGAVSG